MTRFRAASAARKRGDSLERARMLALVRHSSRKPVRAIVATVQRAIKTFEIVSQGWPEYEVETVKEANVLVNKILGGRGAPQIYYVLSSLI